MTTSTIFFGVVSLNIDMYGPHAQRSLWWIYFEDHWRPLEQSVSDQGIVQRGWRKLLAFQPSQKTPAKNAGKLVRERSPRLKGLEMDHGRTQSSSYTETAYLTLTGGGGAYAMQVRVRERNKSRCSKAPGSHQDCRIASTTMGVCSLLLL